MVTFSLWARPPFLKLLSNGKTRPPVLAGPWMAGGIDDGSSSLPRSWVGFPLQPEAADALVGNLGILNIAAGHGEA